VLTTATGPVAANFVRNRLLQVLAGAYGLWWLVLAVAPYDRFDWLLENLLVFAFVGLLAATYRRFPLSDLSYLLVTVCFWPCTLSVPTIPTRRHRLADG